MSTDAKMEIKDPKAAVAESRGWSPIVIVAGVATTLGSSLPAGYNIAVVNTPALIVQQFCNSSISSRYNHEITDNQLNILWSVIVSIYLVGAFMSSLSGGWLADRFGRKGAIIINNALGVFAAVLFVACRYANSVEMLLLARFVVGLAAGLTLCTVPMYLTEIAPIGIRGAVGALCPLGMATGVVLGQLMGIQSVLGDESSWHFLFGFYAILVVVASLALPILPESPKYLYVVKGEKMKCAKELSRIRGVPVESLQDELDDLRQTEENEQNAGVEHSLVSVLLSDSLRLPLVLVCMLNSILQLCGINAVFYYSFLIFHNAGISVENSGYATIGTGCVLWIISVLSIFYVNMIGRRPLLIMSLLSCASSLILLTITLIYIDLTHWMPYLCIAAVLWFVVSFGLGIGPIPLFLASELFVVGPRPVAMAYGSMANWASNFAVGMAFPLIQAAIGPYAFLPYIVVTLVVCAFTWVYLPETRGRTPEEISEKLKLGFRFRST